MLVDDIVCTCFDVANKERGKASQIPNKKTKKNVLWTISNLDIAILRSIPSFILNLMMSIKKKCFELPLLARARGRKQRRLNFSNEEIHETRKFSAKHWTCGWRIYVFPFDAESRALRHWVCGDLMGQERKKSNRIEKLLTWITHDTGCELASSSEWKWR